MEGCEKPFMWPEEDSPETPETALVEESLGAR